MPTYVVSRCSFRHPEFAYGGICNVHVLVVRDYGLARGLDEPLVLLLNCFGDLRLGYFCRRFLRLASWRCGAGESDAMLLWPAGLHRVSCRYYSVVSVASACVQSSYWSLTCFSRSMVVLVLVAGAFAKDLAPLVCAEDRF